MSEVVRQVERRLPRGSARPNVLVRQGWTRKSLQAGDQVTVNGAKVTIEDPRGSAKHSIDAVRPKIGQRSTPDS